MINAIYSPSEFPWARAYFNYQPIEPGGPGLRDVAVNPTDAWFAKVTLNDLHRVATALPNGSDMVLYTHGDADRDIGISMWTDNGYRVLLTLDVVQGLCDLSPEDFQRKFKVPAALVSLFHRQIAEIQACQLNHVAFRSCNIGKRPEYLQAFARLFNIRTVSAPKMRDFFTVDTFRKLDSDEMATADQRATPQALGKLTKTSRNGMKSDAKYRTIQVGTGVVKVLLIPVSYAGFSVEIFASSAPAVEQFYRDNFRFRSPVRFTDLDFRGTDLNNQGILSPFAKPLPLFGLSEYGSHDRVLFPGEAAYVQQIETVVNQHYLGGLPMYNAPLPGPNEKVGTLRDRLRAKVTQVLHRN